MIVLSGCGSAETDRPTTYPVTGIVRYNGQPLAGAYVTFESTGAEAQTAYGTTNEQGEFTLTTSESGDGAVPGPHRVIVQKLEAAAAGTSGDVPPGGPTAPPPKPKSLIPERYASVDSSGLTATVSADGDNEVVLELTD